MSKPSSSKERPEEQDAATVSKSASLFRNAQLREAFDNWLHCICIVTFDLELGQVIEVGILSLDNVWRNF